MRWIVSITVIAWALVMGVSANIGGLRLERGLVRTDPSTLKLSKTLKGNRTEDEEEDERNGAAKTVKDRARDEKEAEEDESSGAKTVKDRAEEEDDERNGAKMAKDRAGDDEEDDDEEEDERNGAKTAKGRAGEEEDDSNRPKPVNKGRTGEEEDDDDERNGAKAAKDRAGEEEDDSNRPKPVNKGRTGDEEEEHDERNGAKTSKGRAGDEEDDSNRPQPGTKGRTGDEEDDSNRPKPVNKGNRTADEDGGESNGAKTVKGRTGDKVDDDSNVAKPDNKGRAGDKNDDEKNGAKTFKRRPGDELDDDSNVAKQDNKGRAGDKNDDGRNGAKTFTGRAGDEVDDDSNGAQAVSKGRAGGKIDDKKNAAKTFKDRPEDEADEERNGDEAVNMGRTGDDTSSESIGDEDAVTPETGPPTKPTSASGSHTPIVTMLDDTNEGSRITFSNDGKIANEEGFEDDWYEDLTALPEISVKSDTDDGTGGNAVAGGLSTGAIAGIVFAAGVGVALSAAAVYHPYQKNKNDGNQGATIRTLSSTQGPTTSGGSSAATTYGNTSVPTMDYDYSGACGGTGGHSVSEAGGTLGSCTRQTGTDDPAMLPGSGNTIFSDDPTFVQAYEDVREELLDVYAPAGKLGIVIDTPDDGAPMIHDIKDGSPIADKVQVGDKLVAVDDEDVRAMAATNVSKLIGKRGVKASRKLTIIRHV